MGLIARLEKGQFLSHGHFDLRFAVQELLQLLELRVMSS
jgi:hypothetical protein